MSFIIAVHVNEGIVLASDRRTTYTTTITNGMITTKMCGIHTTNSTDKTFICPNGCGISICGEADFLGKPITGFVKDFIRKKVSETTNVEEIPLIMADYFGEYESIPDIKVIVAGYDLDTKEQKIIRGSLRKRDFTAVDSTFQGSCWDGETDTLTRLIQPMAIKKQDGSFTEMSQNPILWQYFTLQDAVDFARYAVESTINTMHFKNMVETVGGGVDILVITPEETKWLQKSEIK